MKKLILICLSLCFVTACAEKKQPLASTQIVNGKSIVMPPEFFVLPQSEKQTLTPSHTAIKE